MTFRFVADHAALAGEVFARRGRTPPLVWIQPAAATDESNAALIAWIESTLANEGVDYLTGSLEDFKTLIVGQAVPKLANRVRTQHRFV